MDHASSLKATLVHSSHSSSSSDVRQSENKPLDPFAEFAVFPNGKSKGVVGQRAAPLNTPISSQLPSWSTTSHPVNIHSMKAASSTAPRHSPVQVIPPNYRIGTAASSGSVFGGGKQSGQGGLGGGWGETPVALLFSYSHPCLSVCFVDNIMTVFRKHDGEKENKQQFCSPLIACQNRLHLSRCS